SPGSRSTLTRRSAPRSAPPGKRSRPEAGTVSGAAHPPGRRPARHRSPSWSADVQMRGDDAGDLLRVVTKLLGEVAVQPQRGEPVDQRPRRGPSGELPDVGGGGAVQERRGGGPRPADLRGVPGGELGPGPGLERGPGADRGTG